MIKRKRVIRQVLIAAFLCAGITIAQEPVQNIDRQRHPNLAEAQHLIAEANKRIIAAQNDNHEDMRGHAEKARDLLVRANEELKLAADAANASGRKP